MAQSDGIFGAHLRNLNKALDQTVKRQGLIAQNMANVNTPGYKRQDLTFGIELEDAMGRSSMLNRDSNEAYDPSMRTNTGSMRRDGNSVDLEAEVAAMAETEFRYRMLTEMTNRYFNGLKNAIKEGR